MSNTVSYFIDIPRAAILWGLTESRNIFYKVKKNVDLNLLAIEPSFYSAYCWRDLVVTYESLVTVV